MNRGFTSTVISVCSGTNVFGELLKVSVARSLLHFLALSIICAFLAIGLLSLMNYGTIEKYCNYLDTQLGHLKFTEKGLVPGRDPERQRNIKFGNARVDYIPGEISPSVFNPEDSLSEIGVLWVPDSLILWRKIDSEFHVFPMLFSLSNMPVKKKITGNVAAEMIDYAKKYAFQPMEYMKLKEINFTNYLIPILVILMLFSFMEVLFTTLFFIPLFALFFTSVFLLSGKAELPDDISFKSLFSVAIYASFPGIIIGSLYYGLRLPFLDFQSVCLMSFLIYLVIVINKLKKLKNPDPDEEEENYDDY